MKLKKTLIALACGFSVTAIAAVGTMEIATDHSHDHPHGEVDQHGGGLDQCGGHYDHKTGLYHYHRAARC